MSQTLKPEEDIGIGQYKPFFIFDEKAKEPKWQTKLKTMLSRLTHRIILAVAVPVQVSRMSRRLGTRLLMMEAIQLFLIFDLSVEDVKAKELKWQTKQETMFSLLTLQIIRAVAVNVRRTRTIQPPSIRPKTPFPQTSNTPEAWLIRMSQYQVWRTRKW
jgi:hypothetical protein